MMTRHLIAVAGLFAAVTGCMNAPSSPGAPPARTGCPAPQKATAGAYGLAAAGDAAPSAPAASATPTVTRLRQVTFYGDLLPILASNDHGRVYKCTTCHAHYATPDGLNSVAEIESIINSLQTGRMPRAGDAMPQASIDLFRVWQLQGFQPGEPGIIPQSTAPLAAPTTPADGQTTLPCP